MTDYREQAIKDVAEALGEQVSTILDFLANRMQEVSMAEEALAIQYAFAQREARLRLEEELKQALSPLSREEECIAFNQGIGNLRPEEIANGILRRRRAALNAVKEG